MLVVPGDAGDSTVEAVFLPVRKRVRIDHRRGPVRKVGVHQDEVVSPVDVDVLVARLLPRGRVDHLGGDLVPSATRAAVAPQDPNYCPHRSAFVC